MTKEQKTKGRADETDAFVGQRLRELRTAAGMSQEDIADAVGVTFQQIQKYEKGSNRVSAGMVYKLAGLLGVPVATFFPDQPGKDALVEALSDENQRLRALIASAADGLKEGLKAKAMAK